MKLGRDWLEENDVEGTLSRSTGSVKVPLMIKSRRSTVGFALLDHCIAKLTSNGLVLWQHPNYSIATLTIRPVDVNDQRLKSYLWAVDADGENVANFKTRVKAERYVDFVKGTRVKG